MTDGDASSQGAPPNAVAEKLAAFVALREAEGWAPAIQAIADEVARWPAKRRQRLFVAMAEDFTATFPGAGIDTELERIQLARLLAGLIAGSGVEQARGALRTSIELSRRSRDHERIVELGQELLDRFPERADYANQAIGASLFTLKRVDEAVDYLTRVAPSKRTPATQRMLERIAAGSQVDEARELFGKGVAHADAGEAPAAEQAINAAVAALHPRPAGDLLPQTAAALSRKTPARARRAAPDQGPVPLFCGGFRWSGASAIYDFLADQPSVAMFPRRPRFMQDADGALEQLLAVFGGSRDEVVSALRAFVAQQVIGIAPGASKRANALRTLENSILEQLGDDTDAAGMDRGLAAFAGAVMREARKAPGKRAFPRVAFSAALRATSATFAPAGDGYVLFDSVIRASGAHLMAEVPGARLVAVFRDPRDMYVTHVERGRWRKGVDRYIAELQELLHAYDAAVEDAAVASACTAVRFEQLVGDPAVRRDLLSWLGMDPDAAAGPGARFVPQQSASNIGIHRAFADQDAIRKLEAAFPDRCDAAAPTAVPAAAAAAAPPDPAAAAPAPAAPATAAARPAPSDAAIKVVTLSVMATRRQQLDRMGLAGRPGEPGWARRREIVVNLLHDGGYDFIGLQHCFTTTDPSFDAAGLFRDRLAERGADYGVVNRAGGEDADVGDSTPLYYRADRWELDADDHGFAWFATPQPPADAPGGGGLLFVYGLFHETAAGGSRSGRCVYVYNVRLRNRDSEQIDVYRAKCFLEIDRHMAGRAVQSAPVVLLGDLNTKIPDSLSDRLMRGLPASFEGADHDLLTPLQDTLLAADPGLHGKVRSQHDFARPGDVAGTARNDRVLASKDLEVVSAEIVTYNEDGAYPSYHYPVRAELRFGDDPA